MYRPTIQEVRNLRNETGATLRICRETLIWTEGDKRMAYDYLTGVLSSVYHELPIERKKKKTREGVKDVLLSELEGI